MQKNVFLTVVLVIALIFVLLTLIDKRISAFTELNSTAINDGGLTGLGKGTATQASTNASISIVPGSSSPDNGKFFVPSSLNVSMGTTVSWTNRDLTSYKSIEVEQLHTVTSGSLEDGNIGKEFDSGFLNAGKSFSHTFDSTGTFNYFCTIHPFMNGKITVN